MAYDSNMGFHKGMIPSTFYDHRMVSFQSGTVCNSNRIIPAAMNSVGAVNSMEGMIYTAAPSGNNRSLMIPSGNTAGVLHLDPMPGLKHDTGLAVDWSLEEQSLLEKGLVKYSDEPNIMKYIKIAATLGNKTVRDVALRCRWMTWNSTCFQAITPLFNQNKENGKRRKQEEYHTGKKMKDRMEKQADSSSRANVVSSLLPNMPACSFMLHCMDSSNGIIHEVSSIDGLTQLLLEENAQLLCQIENNLDILKLQDNVNLFFHTKNNITAIQKRMGEMPGIMSWMPPLPESTNEKLFDTLFVAPQALMFCTPGGGIHLRQEPRF